MSARTLATYANGEFASARAASSVTTRSPRKVFLPANVRLGLDALGLIERLALETHLENLATLADDPRRFIAAQDGFGQEAGRLISEASGFAIYFTVDPYTRAIFVHRISATSAPRGARG